MGSANPVFRKVLKAGGTSTSDAPNGVQPKCSIRGQIGVRAHAKARPSQIAGALSQIRIRV